MLTLVLSVNFLTAFDVDSISPAAIPACGPDTVPRPPGSRPDTAFQITASDYSPTDGDVLLGDDFPSQWCMLASVNCDPSQAGTLLYYEDGDGFGFGMDISNGQCTFDLRSESFSTSVQLCDNTWNQFSVCYNGGSLAFSQDCVNPRLLGRPADPQLSTTTGTLTIFRNSSGGNDYDVSLQIIDHYLVTVLCLG